MQSTFQKSLFYFHDQADKLYKHQNLTLFVIALIAISYFSYRVWENKQQQTGFLLEPKVNDVLILDMGHLIRDRKYQTQYRVAQIFAINEDTVTLKQGSYTYRKKRGAERAIRLDGLMQSDYFRPAMINFNRSDLLALHEKGAIDEIFRPTDIYVMGGIVKQRAAPEFVAYRSEVTFNHHNQQGVKAYLSLDYNAARALFKQSAEQGHDWGQYNLADMLEHGEGGNIDLAGAYKWYMRAAEQNNLKAKEALASFCDRHNALCN